MDVEKTVRKELRGQSFTFKKNNTLATTVATHIQKKIHDKRVQDKKKAGKKHQEQPTQEVQCYCQEEIAAKLLNEFLEDAQQAILQNPCILTTIPYDDLKEYAKKNDLAIQPLQLSPKEQEALALVYEHGDDQTLHGLRKSFEYLQKEYEKQREEQVKK